MAPTGESQAYLGIVIEQSLDDPAVAALLNVVARKNRGDWIFWLAEAAEADLNRHVRLLQQHLGLGWYAHYFRDRELIVVYKDAVFRVTTDPHTWHAMIQHGLAQGIPVDQLDFVPNTKARADAFFRSRDAPAAGSA